MSKLANSRASKNCRSGTTAVQIPAEIDEPDLRQLWLEKYRFNISTLRLSEADARAWATRAVRVKKEVAETELECSH